MKKLLAASIFLTLIFSLNSAFSTVSHAQSAIDQADDQIFADSPPESHNEETADQAALQKVKDNTTSIPSTIKSTTKSLFSSGGYKVDSASANLPARVGRVINIVFAISGTIFLAMVIYSGIRWMTAGGDSDEIKKCRKRVVRASIGLLILLMSWILTNFVLRGVLIGAPSSGGRIEFSAPGQVPINAGSASVWR